MLERAPWFPARSGGAGTRTGPLWLHYLMLGGPVPAGGAIIAVPVQFEEANVKKNVIPDFSHKRPGVVRPLVDGEKAPTPHPRQPPKPPTKPKSSGHRGA